MKRTMDEEMLTFKGCFFGSLACFAQTSEVRFCFDSLFSREPHQKK